MQLLLKGVIQAVQNIEIYDQVSKKTNHYVEVSIQHNPTTQDETHTRVILCSDYEKKLKKSIGNSILIPYIHTTYWDDNKKKEISILKMDKNKQFSIYPNNLLGILYFAFITIWTKGVIYGK